MGVAMARGLRGRGAQPGPQEGGSPGGRGGPPPTPRRPPVFSEALVCRTPRFADCDAPKRPMVAYPCRLDAVISTQSG